MFEEIRGPLWKSTELENIASLKTSNLRRFTQQGINVVVGKNSDGEYAVFRNKDDLESAGYKEISLAEFCSSLPNVTSKNLGDQVRKDVIEPLIEAKLKKIEAKIFKLEAKGKEPNIIASIMRVIQKWFGQVESLKREKRQLKSLLVRITPKPWSPPKPIPKILTVTPLPSTPVAVDAGGMRFVELSPKVKKASKDDYNAKLLARGIDVFDPKVTSAELKTAIKEQDPTRVRGSLRLMLDNKTTPSIDFLKEAMAVKIPDDPESAKVKSFIIRGILQCTKPSHLQEDGEALKELAHKEGLDDIAKLLTEKYHIS